LIDESRQAEELIKQRPNPLATRFYKDEK